MTKLRCNITVAALTSLMLVGAAWAGSQHEKTVGAPTLAAGKGAVKPGQTAAPDTAQIPDALTVDPADAAEQDYLAHDYIWVDSPDIDQYLRGVEQKLWQAAKQTGPAPRIVIFSADEFNAATDPNGIIAIWSGTLRQLESEDELAALLGHELAHALLKHPHSKSVLSNFPAGVDLAGAIAATASQQVAVASQAVNNVQTAQGKKAGATAAHAATFASQSLRTSSDTSLFWSDLLAPSWNRKQERQADYRGAELMEAAGYNPDAFGTLLDKLTASEAKRSARLQQLRQKVVAAAQRQAGAVVNGGKPQSENVAGVAGQVLQGGVPTPSVSTLVRFAPLLIKKYTDPAAEKVVNGIFDEIDKATKDYDSPAERKRLIAEAHKPAADADSGDLKPRSLDFARILKDGAGGAVLNADAKALQVLAALDAGDAAKVAAAVAAFLPARALSSVHLNYALALYYVEQQKSDLAEAAAVRWMNFAHAPVQAFILRAELQADRQKFAESIATLRDGERRLGKTLPFLPQLVTYARGAADIQLAESLTRQCRDDERNLTSDLQKLISKEGPVYLDCKTRLGYDPDQPHAPLNGAEPGTQPVASINRPVAH